MTHQLLGLRAENFKRLELVEIDFPADGGVVAIMGRNEAGKTSVLDALEVAIAGRKAPKAAKPVHVGAERAEIVATFDDIIVTRTYKPDGQTAIKVTAADGRRIDRSEELLTRLYSHVALDPLAFSRLSDAEQVATLLPMIGYDPAPLDAEKAEAYALRTVKNREVNALEARLAAMPAPRKGLPAEDVLVSDVTARLETAHAHNDARRRAEGEISSTAAAASRAALAVEQLRESLALAEEEHRAAVATADKARETFEALAAEVDVEPLRAEIANADTVNAEIRAARSRAEVVEQLTAASNESLALTKRIDEAAAAKEAALAAAKMPVPGLSIDDDGILTLDGIPFSQASTGVKIRTGTAIAMALNPDLRVIVIRDASLLDAGNRAVIDELARANSFLVLMEIADESMPVGVVIEDGTVAEVRS